MYRFILGFVVLTGLSVGFFGLSPAPASAGIASLEEATKEMVVGDAAAPVTLIEYASLGCPHCANFHKDAYPLIKKNYIDTGKVRMIYRDFPLGTPALAASMISRCGGPGRYFGMVEVFFRGQAQWSRAENPINALKSVARFGGMSGTDVDACLQNQELLNYIQKTAREGQEKHEINATPSFVLGGRTISGSLPYEDFKKLLDAELEKAK